MLPARDSFPATEIEKPSMTSAAAAEDEEQQRDDREHDENDDEDLHVDSWFQPAADDERCAVTRSNVTLNPADVLRARATRCSSGACAGTAALRRQEALRNSLTTGAAVIDFLLALCAALALGVVVWTAVELERRLL